MFAVKANRVLRYNAKKVTEYKKIFVKSNFVSKLRYQILVFETYKLQLTMLHKPIKIKSFTVLTMVISFWLYGLSSFAQSNRQAPTEPVKKQEQAAKPKVSLSNHDTQLNKQNEAAVKRAEMEQKRKEKEAIEAKQANLKEASKLESKQAQQKLSLSNQASSSATSKANSNINDANKADIQKEWALKKAKAEAALKAKGLPQDDIDKHIALMEKEFNITNNSNK